MKRCLRKIVGQQRLSLTELLTVLTAAEACLNSHPMAAIESMADDGVEPLTPFHFTTGRGPAALITDTTQHYTITLNERWNLVQQLQHQLWRRYFTEYVTLLKQYHPQRYKNGNKTNLQVGDIVLVKDKVLFQHYWPMARITEIHPGTDGIVRAVTVLINGDHHR